jgi:hypothetical protein
MSFRFFGRRWSVWVPIAAGGIAIGLLILVMLLAWLLQPKPAAQIYPTAVFNVIPAPTSTLVNLAGIDITPTPTNSHLIVGGIGVGMYVQISGTGGDGLRLHSNPGTSSAPRFLGHEAEVFQVKDGPEDADGYTWWYLVTPMDASRSGWAAANYLSVVTAPTP